MKAETILIVRMSSDDAEEFYAIRESDARKVLTLPYGERATFVLHNSKEARVHSTAEEDLHIDNSGNQTAQEFWESEGNEQWAEMFE
jgi:hypothetical protein